MNQRSTFRPIVAGEVAWQRQLRDRYAAEPAPDVDLDLRSSVVRPISRKLAEAVILRYEWLGTLPPVQRYYGLFFGPYLAGATAVAVGNGTAGAFTSRQYGVERNELATLTRGACVHWSPTGANSRLVAWTVRLLARDDPAARILVAYADSEAGEIGTIYQACGWSYLGPGSKVIEYVSPSGRVWNTRALGPTSHDGGRTVSRGWAPVAGPDRTRRAEEALLAAGWSKQWSNPKLRYAVVLRPKTDRDLASRVASMALPYPKRPSAAADQSSGEGESDDARGDQSRKDASRRSRRSNPPGLGSSETEEKEAP